MTNPLQRARQHLASATRHMEWDEDKVHNAETDEEAVPDKFVVIEFWHAYRKFMSELFRSRR